MIVIIFEMYFIMFNFAFPLAADSSGSLMLVAMFAIIIIMFVFSSRSNKKREMEERQMLSALQVGDEITTHSGIIGKIVSIKGETFVLETTREKTKIRFLKTAIARVDVRAADLAATVINAPAEPTAAKEAPQLKEEAPKEKMPTARKRKAPATEETATEAPKAEEPTENTEASN